MKLTETLEKLSVDIKALDEQIADVIKAVTENHVAEIKKIRMTYAAAIEEGREANEAEMKELETALRLAEKEASEYEEMLEEARELSSKVDAETLGVLDTSTLPQRLLFEKIEANWGHLSYSQIELLESVLDGNVNYL
jgi:predicted RNase H-like nuclease (RuvC/YqgF family)